ncbi:hypothetical protein ACFL67_01780 [candidate division KSB1 bacterium]
MKRIFQIIAALSVITSTNTLFSQSFFHSTQVKTEYQYSDYFSYEYPDPVLFEYPDVLYSQPLPYIADFPEHRYLFRVIQKFDYRTTLNVKYQHSSLDENISQKIYSALFSRELTDRFSFNVGSQYTDLENRMTGWMLQGGCTYDFSGFFMIKPQFFYYSNKDQTTQQERSSAFSYSVLARQALNPVTALQVKYQYFRSEGDVNTFDSNTITGWISRFFETETAVHLSLRYHKNARDFQSYSSELEAIQYLNYASILRLSYRYYTGDPDEELFSGNGTAIQAISSHSTSAVLEYLLFPGVTVFAKYRYYFSSRDIKMNTYLFGIERMF